MNYPFLKNPAFSHLRTTYYESLTSLMLLENIPGRLEVLLKSVMGQMERLHSIANFSEQDRVSVRVMM